MLVASDGDETNHNWSITDLEYSGDCSIRAGITILCYKTLARR